MRVKLLIMAVAFLSTCLFAQTEAQKQWLLNFSAQQKIISEKEKAVAESIAVKNNMPIRQVYPDGSVIELQGFENGIPLYHATDNLNSAKTISSDKVWIDNSYGIFSLSGQGQTIGLWEAGGIPLATHQEITGRATLMDNGGSTSAHATHTAGTLIASGVNPNAKGMSNQGHINYYNSTSDLAEISSAASSGLLVSSHSYGLLTGWRYDYRNDGKWAWFGNPAISPTEDYKFGLYTSTSTSWDNVLVNAPNLLVVKSAGNDRDESGPGAGGQYWVVINGSWVLSTDTREPDGGADGYDCIGDPTSLAKNVLTVGAVSRIPAGYNNPSNVAMSSFSSWGPTDDGRIKPDVVSDGVDVLSSTNTSTTAYETMSGTSMATPAVAGSVGLLLELQQSLNPGVLLRSSTMKGIIIHTADEAGTYSGPDYRFGWGLMNTFKAAQLMRINNQTGNTMIKEETLNNGGQYQFQVQSIGKDPLKVTICWLDPGGSPAGTILNPPNLMLKNDLDIRITGPNSTTYYPWVLDKDNPSAAATTGDNIRDNVEQILIANPVAGTYTVTVTHKGTLVNNSQPFSLIITGITIAVPPTASLVSPASGTTGVTGSTILKWNVLDRAYVYHLQVSADANFTSLVYDNDSILAPYQQLDNSFLTGNHQYYWRVSGVNSGGEGEWSTAWNFTTDVIPPTAPQLVLPADSASGIAMAPYFEWSSIGAADKYWLQVSNNTIFTSLAINDSSITIPHFQAPELSEGKKYLWRVKSLNQAGGSDFSISRMFYTRLKTPTNLAAVATENGVQLTWTDNSSLETKYYITSKPQGEYSIIDSVLANTTTYLDTSALHGTHYYKVYAANNTTWSDSSDEAVVVVDGINDNKTVPTEYSLMQNYPNPFNPSTVIKYSLPSESKVKLIIYNSLGEVVETAVNGTVQAGYHEYNWNAKRYSSGVYFYSIEAEPENGTAFRSVMKMLLIK